MLCAALLALALTADPKPRLDADGIPLPAEALRRFGSARFCTDPPRAMAFSPDGKVAFSLVGGYGGWFDNWPNLTAWEVSTGRRLWAFTAPDFAGRTVTAAPDGNTVWLFGRVGQGSDPKQTTAVRLKLDPTTGRELDRVELGKSWSDAHDLQADGTLIWNRYDVKENDLTVRALKPDGTDALAWDPEEQAVGLLRLSPDGKTLYVGGRAYDGPGWKLSAVDLPTGKTKWSVDTAMQDTLAVSPDGKVVAMAVASDPLSKGPRAQQPEHESPMLTRIVGRHAGSGEEFGAVFVGKDNFKAFMNGAPGAGRPLKFTPDGKQVLTMNDRGKTVAILTKGWEADGGPRDDRSACGWLTPDGKSYFTSDYGYNLRQFDAATHTESDPPPHLPSRDYRRAEHWLRFSPEGTQFLFGSVFTPKVLWDVSTGNELERIPRGKQAQTAWLRDAGIGPDPDRHPWLHSPDGKLRLRVFRAGRGMDTGTAIIEDVKSEERVAELTTPDLFWVAFSPDSKKVAGFGREWKLRVWDVATGGEAVAETTVAVRETPQHIRVHPTENWFAVAEFQGKTKDVRAEKWLIHRYEFDKLERTKTWEMPGSVGEFNFTPDGRIVGWLGEPGWRASSVLSGFVIDPTKGKPFVIELINSGRAITFAPDHRSIAVGTSRGSVLLYELATGQRRYAFIGLNRSIRELAFSPDGKTLASESADGPVILWDVKGELTRPAKPDATGWEGAWQAITGDDAEQAFAAVRLVAAYPDEGAAELKRRFAEVKSPTAVSAERAVEALRLADTDSARKQIAEWAKGPENDPLTAAAKRK